jgi:hypothetical protein
MLKINQFAFINLSINIKYISFIILSFLAFPSKLLAQRDIPGRNIDASSTYVPMDKELMWRTLQKLESDNLENIDAFDKLKYHVLETRVNYKDDPKVQKYASDYYDALLEIEKEKTFNKFNFKREFNRFDEKVMLIIIEQPK